MDVGTEASSACPVWGLWVGPRGGLEKPTRALECVGPPRTVWGLTRIYCLASGMQRGHVKCAESGNIGTSGRRKRYSEQRLWFI